MKNLKKIIALLMIAAMALALLTACGSSASDTSAAEEENSAAAEETEETAAEEPEAAASGLSTDITLGLEFPIVTNDPQANYEGPFVVGACYETLFKTLPDGSVENWLADSYEFSEDGTVLTVTLKDGITFASGNTMTADDVVFSIKRLANLEGSPFWMALSITDIQALDDKTVQITLAEADAAFLATLANNAFGILDSQVAMENGATDADDAATTDTAGEWLNTNSCGSGQFVLTEYVPDEKIVLTRNDNYWGEYTTNVTSITYVNMAAETQYMSLMAGDIDGALNMSTDSLDAVSDMVDSGEIYIDTVLDQNIAMLFMNRDESISGPLADAKVQQAVRLALNYADIQAYVGEGSVTPATVFPISMAGSVGERTEGTDLDAAKALMEEAGYADGFDVDLEVCTLAAGGVGMDEIATMIKDQLAEIGINVNIIVSDWNNGYSDAYRNGELAMTVMYWTPDYNDPNAQLSLLPGGSASERAGWTIESDPDYGQTLADLASAAKGETDYDARMDIISQIQDILVDNGAIIPVVQFSVHYAYKTGLTASYRDGAGLNPISFQVAE